MTQTLPPPTEAAPPPEEPAQQAHAPGPPASPEIAPAEVPMPILSLAGAAFCSSVAATFLVGGLYIGFLARVVAVVAPLLGVGLVAIALRTRRSLLQVAVVPVAIVLGVILILPETSGQGSSNIVDAVIEAISGGGLLQPPVSFDPGWQLILVVVGATLGAGTLAAATSFGKPRLAVVIPLPLAMLAEFVQPKGTEILGTAVAAILLVGAIGFSYGAELQREGAVRTGSFELRRMTRTGGLAAAMLAVILVLSQTSFLFPQPERNTVTPPMKPQASPPQQDRRLFTYDVEGDSKIPFRLGTIDIYDPKQNAWLLPPYDTSRFQPLNDSGAVPAGRPAKGATFNVFVTIANQQGHVIPAVYGTDRITGLNAPVEYDPRTGIIQLTDRPLAPGMSYELTVLAPPNGAQLAAAPKSTGGVSDFLAAPPPPQVVTDLLFKAPADPFDRMQYLRNALLTKVVASGIGQPVDLPVSRVTQMLNGGEASPYEISAAEGLLARWAGVPSRIGYGYYDGPVVSKGTHEMRPAQGSTWLEAYFSGYGWVPVTGVPLQAKNSLDNNAKNTQSLIRPSGNVSVFIYVATRDRSPLAYFQVLAYWVGVVLPWLVLAVLIYIVHPAGFKVARYVLRRRWARTRGPSERILVAYAEFRDLANDLTYGDPIATPLEYRRYVQEDVEHEDLAWLVTRATWGDIRRDISEADAEYAEQLSRSLIRRLARAQSVPNLFSALIARTSLRDPFSDAIPRAWPHRRKLVRFNLGAPMRGIRRRVVARRVRAAGVVGMLLMLVGCGSDARFHGPTQLRGGMTPASVGTLQLVHDASLDKQYANADPTQIVQKGEVWVVHDGTILQGTVQISLVNSDVRADEPGDQSVFAGLNSGIAGQDFTQVRITDDQVVWEKVLLNQRIFLWFPPRSNAIELVVLRLQFTGYNALVKGLIDYQHGRAPQAPPSSTASATPSPSAGTGGTP